MKYVRKIVDDYCVLDLETTGLSFDFCEIIEIGILKVHQNEIIDQYQQLIKPEEEVDEFITKLTGITNEMLEDQPSILEVKEDVLNFIGDSLIVGHNTYFDKNFIESKFNVCLPNEYIDTLQFSRKLFPELKHHRLKDMVELLGLTNNMHRSISDCVATKELYDNIKKIMNEKGLHIDDLFAKERKRNKKSFNLKSIVPTTDEIDEDSFFYQKHCVFTGALEKMIRKDAAQIVVNVGGIVDNNVTKETNFLILGNNDFCKSIKGGKSNKQKKAESLKLKGQDIEILDENTFYKMIGVEFTENEEVKNKPKSTFSVDITFNEEEIYTPSFIMNSISKAMDELKNRDNDLSDFIIYDSASKKWSSIKVDGKTLIKITYPTKNSDYIFEYGNYISETTDPLSELINNINGIYELYKEISSAANDETFGCCGYYLECSDAKKCIMDNEFSRNCYYRKNLEAGKIFYGKNRNI